MIDRRTLVEWNDILMFLADAGIYMFDGSNLRNISDGVVNKEVDSWANKTSPVATLWDNKYVLSNTSSGGSSNDEALFFDLTRNIFGKFEGVNASAWTVWDGGNDDGRLYFASSNQGSIYRWDVGGNDDGFEIETRYFTPSLGLGVGTNDKNIKRFYLQQLALGSWEMNVTQFADILSDEISVSVELAGGSVSLWDVDEWDVATWSDEGTILTTRIAEFQGLAKYYKFKFEQTGYDEGLEILGMTMEARVRRLR